MQDDHHRRHGHRCRAAHDEQRSGCACIDRLSRLTPRERLVLSRLTEEDTLEEIASSLFVSRNTVKTQVRSVYRKLEISSRTEAAAWARVEPHH